MLLCSSKAALHKASLNPSLAWACPTRRNDFVGVLLGHHKDAWRTRGSSTPPALHALWRRSTGDRIFKNTPQTRLAPNRGFPRRLRLLKKQKIEKLQHREFFHAPAPRPMKRQRHEMGTFGALQSERRNAAETSPRHAARDPPPIRTEKPLGVMARDRRESTKSV